MFKVKKIVFVIEEEYLTNGPEKSIVDGLSKNLLSDYSYEIVTCPVALRRRLNKKIMNDFYNRLTIATDNAVALVAIACSVSYCIIPKFSKFPSSLSLISYMGDSNVRGLRSVLDSIRCDKLCSNLKNRCLLKMRIKLYGHKEQKVLDRYEKILYITNTDVQYAVSNYQVDKAKVGLLEYAINKAPDIKTRQPGNLLKVGFIGTFHPNSISLDLDWFINATEKIIENNNLNIKIIIAGRRITEQQRDELNQYKFVECIGEVESLEEFYNSIDFVFSTVTKTAGVLTKVVEAFSYGKMVLGYRKNFDGIDAMKEGIHYIPVDTEEELESALKHIVDKKVDIVAMGRMAKAELEKCFTWDVRAKELINFIEKE